MKKLSIREVRKELVQFDGWISRAGEVAVTRRGQPITRVPTAWQQATDAVRAELRASMPRLKNGTVSRSIFVH